MSGKRSKRRSATTDATSPLEVFLDENRDSPKLVAALTELGLAVHRHRDCFPRGAEDEAWVPTVVSRGWVILTTDRGRGDKIMLMVLQRSCARALIFSPKMPPAECAAVLGVHRERIRRALHRSAPPLALYVRRAEVMAHDFAGGPKRRVLGNGTIQAPREGSARRGGDRADD